MQLALPLLEHEPLSPPPTLARSRVGESGGGDSGAARIVMVRHRRARRYVLRVLDDGTLRVTLPWRGSKREAMAFVEQNAEWIAKQRSVSATTWLRRDWLRATQSFARSRAKNELPPALMALAERHGISVTRVSIRNQRSRWGACSARGSITLNWRLILVPGFVRDYVMIHELMHRRELNHSKRFWGHVRAACPRYREARQWLLTEGPQFFS
jgi:predicted metal-dependent hydrolase